MVGGREEEIRGKFSADKNRMATLREHEEDGVR